ncbi:MAG: protein phosphatase 2C domain-containing protein [Victivallaceae bacterium]|nr:protein phosphatase 2C domain-containing protein [Victivallaceae bacterium]
MNEQPVSTTPLGCSFAGETHLGLIRDNNEDSFLYCSNPGELNSLAVVADGIGGLENGEVASLMCCNHLLDAWRGKKFSQEKSERKLCNFLNREITAVNSDIFHFNKKEHKAESMGTTVVAVIFCPDKIIVAHAGDSRLYRIRKGHLNPLTEDHSFVNALIKKNIIKYEEANAFPFSHVIMKSLGPMEHLELDINIFKREPDDRYLICSDGLTTHLADHKIESIMKKAKEPEGAIDKMMRGALIKGGLDNITIVCCFPEH